MKANAPDKIYLEKVYPDNGVLPNGLNYNQSPNDIEYIKKDAFIEKACEFILLNAADYIDVTHKGGIEHLALQESFIENFKKYIEGE